MLVRADKFVLSHKPYALALDTFHIEPRGFTAHTGQPMWMSGIDALWFRRKAGVLAVHVGSLWDVVVCDAEPAVESFLAGYGSSRYGGSVTATWDGSRFWSNDVTNRAAQNDLIAILDPALSAHPDVPAGYSGWYLARE